jgi:hypothetical protein
LDFDRTHAFVATYIYELPKLGDRLGNNRLTRGLFNGWELSGVTSLIGGNPFELGVGVTGSNANQRITGSWTEPSRFRLNGDPARGPNGLLIDPNAFIIPEIGSLGLGERTYMRNPGINNTDLAIFKNFSVGNPDKGRKLQLRVEVFNVFNHTQFSGINAGTNLAVPNGVDAFGNQQFLTGNDIFGNATTARYNRAVISNNIRGQRPNDNPSLNLLADSKLPLGRFFGEYNGDRSPRIVQLGVKFSW